MTATVLSNTAEAPEPGAVLTKALLRAAHGLGLSARAVGQTIGVSEASVSRMKSGGFILDPASKSFELAALVVRVFRSLDAITGGDGSTMRAWMSTANSALGGRPVELIMSVSGLTYVLGYLDARRAPI